MELITMWKIGTSLQILMASGSFVASLGLAIMIIRKMRTTTKKNKTAQEEHNQRAGNSEGNEREGNDQEQSSELPWKRQRKATQQKEKEGHPLVRIIFCIAVSDVLQSLGVLGGKWTIKKKKRVKQSAHLVFLIWF